MTRFGLAIILAAALVACTKRSDSSARGEGSTRPIAITHVTLITPDGAGAAQVFDQTVVIHNGIITAQGRSVHAVNPPPDAIVIEGRGKFLMPGLWDAHAHLSHAGPAALAAYVANGVTSVRDLGGRIDRLFQWRRQIENGELVGPRLFVAGPNIEGAWWLDAVTALLRRDSALAVYPFFENSPRMRLADAADAARVVDSLAALDVDYIKFRNLRADEFRAVAAAARRRGLPLVGHAPARLSLAEAADSGVVSIEHMETVMIRLGDADSATRHRQFAALARSGIAITATLVTDQAYRQTPDSVAHAALADTSGVHDPRRRLLSAELRAAWKFGLDTKRIERPNDWAASHRRQVADLRIADAAGVPILVGTDLGVSLVYPGSSVHEELRLLVEVGGLTPREALRGATELPARSLRRDGVSARIAVGERADLVLVAADPLEDIRNTTRIDAVIVNGRLFDRQGISRLMESAERLARQ